MPTLYSEALSSVRERLDELTARHWTDSMLNKWIYEGCKDVARNAEVLLTTADIEGTEGTQKYDLPTDMVRVYRAVWTNENDDSEHELEYMDFNNASAVWWTQKALTQGNPEIFTMWGVLGSAEIVLYPTPSQDGNIEVQYYRLPAKPEDFETIDEELALEVPEGWEDLVYAYVEYRALRQDRDGNWQAAKAEYDEQFDKMMTLTRRYSDQNGQRIQGDYPAVNSWLYEFE